MASALLGRGGNAQKEEEWAGAGAQAGFEENFHVTSSAALRNSKKRSNKEEEEEEEKWKKWYEFLTEEIETDSDCYSDDQDDDMDDDQDDEMQLRHHRNEDLPTLTQKVVSGYLQGTR